jgi:hypothetical protein
VGHEGWAARGGSSSTSASPTDSLNAGSEQPAGAAALQQQQAAPAPPLLGVHVSAASHPQPGLPGLRGPLLPTWRALARLAAPLLHPASLATPVKLSLLLHGPRGSGKQVAVRAAAAALGVNVIPWSAYDLKVGLRQQRAHVAAVVLLVLVVACGRCCVALLAPAVAHLLHPQEPLPLPDCLIA